MKRFAQKTPPRPPKNSFPSLEQGQTFQKHTKLRPPKTTQKLASFPWGKGKGSKNTPNSGPPSRAACAWEGSQPPSTKWDRRPGEGSHRGRANRRNGWVGSQLRSVCSQPRCDLSQSAGVPFAMGLLRGAGAGSLYDDPQCDGALSDGPQCDPRERDWPHYDGSVPGVGFVALRGGVLRPIARLVANPGCCVRRFAMAWFALRRLPPGPGRLPLRRRQRASLRSATNCGGPA